MPTVIIIAGPNGAGKTTFANEYLSEQERGYEFINADEIARSLGSSAAAGGQADILAARTMLNRIDEFVSKGASFVIETTLANLTYAHKIPPWRERGYLVTLIYLRCRRLTLRWRAFENASQWAGTTYPKRPSNGASARASTT